MTDTPETEMSPAFDTAEIRHRMENWDALAQTANETHTELRSMTAELADTEDVPIQMVTATIKLAENYLNVADQLLGMKSNFTRWLDAIDGKHVAEEAGGADGLGA